MILFLNFAPLSFGGGVERWILDLADSLKKSEEVSLLEVNENIANIYSMLVLKRSFDSRLDNSKLEKFRLNQISLKALIPFTKDWYLIKNEIALARKIYTKLEVNELVLLYYFGGNSIFNKTIIGTHSPLLYLHNNKTFFETLHNKVYLSKQMGNFLRKFKAVHVLTDEQEKILKNNFDLKNIVKIPNYVFSTLTTTDKKRTRDLKIGFVGELTWRKGIDIFSKLIEISPSNYFFYIIGDGPGKNLILQHKKKNVNYMGYKTNEEVMKILENLDILIQPSRAESFSLVSLEAMSKGVVVLSSILSTSDSVKPLVMLSENNVSSEYLELMKNAYNMKQTGKLESKSKELINEINKNYSKEQIVSKLKTNIFN